ncbi:MAG: NADP-dependent malic enzyme [Dehalococcoidia bacterium]|nr:NADP-dependent malic enzyme [Dehalococcoidia bacterium]MDD5494312.1 NADP-dependent malic enzyme [Dehalococcoidia bacterium]
MSEKLTVEELLARARKPAEVANKLHKFYKGKMQTIPRCVIRDFNDFAIWYTPGVASPCKAIQADKDKAYDYTNKWNTIAVVSDGTRVLGLGDIGPEAGMPVMEGKALLFKYLGGVDAVPICLDTKDPDEIIQAVKWLQPSFGGINLEDISNPKCFYILDRLRAEARIPVWHDDQQGTAAVTLAGLINALKIVGKKKDSVKMAVIGSGAANIAILRLLFADGIKPENTIVVDSKGILHKGRSDLEKKQKENPYKWDLCNKTNAENRTGDMKEALKGADVCISLSKSGPGVIQPEWVRGMARDSIVFACANPIPEIWPWEAKEAGVKIFATGRSDFPNQVNNSTGFPAIFRGTLDVRAKTITDEMCLAAAHELAQCAEDRGISEENIAPTMGEWEVFIREAVAVGMKAQEQGVARIKVTREELTKQAEFMIKNAREMAELMMKEGFIAPPPED